MSLGMWFREYVEPKQAVAVTDFGGGAKCHSQQLFTQPVFFLSSHSHFPCHLGPISLVTAIVLGGNHIVNTWKSAVATIVQVLVHYIAYETYKSHCENGTGKQ